MGLALERFEGKYEIVAKIKEGGMGEIYQVRHRLLDEIRVIKVLRAQFEGDEDLNERFAQEARSAIRLRHPNIVQIFDFALDHGIGYIVMEYLDGIDLQALVARRPLPSIGLILEICRQSLRALGYLHSQDFVHRDVSPDNLMLCRDVEDRPLIKMIDLGIAKSLDNDTDRTSVGTFLGKFRYSSPEHFSSHGNGTIEARSDLYSFGVVLYEMLTGEFPIRGDSNSQLIGGHLFQPPRPFAETDPGHRIPEALRKIVIKAMEKDPGERFADAAAFSAAIAELQQEHPLDEKVLEEALRVTEPGAGVSLAAAGPGSTQRRIDQSFGLAATQAPAKSMHLRSVTPLPPRSASSQVVLPSDSHQEQINALLVGAEALLRLEQPEQARIQLDAILSIDPGHQRALKLMQQFDPEAQMNMDTTLRMTEAGPDFDHHLETACRFSEEQQFTAAAEHLRRALDIQPGNPAVRQMLQEAEEQLARQEATHREHLSGEIAQLRSLLEAEQLEEARARLVSARRVYGTASELTQIDGEVRLAMETRDKLRKQVNQELHKAREQAEGADFTSAVVTIDRALSMAGDDEDVLRQLEEFHQDLGDEHLQALEVTRSMCKIEDLIAAGRLVEADMVLFQSIETYGARKGFTALRERIDDSHQSGVEKQARKLMKEAEDLAGSGEYTRAFQILDKARISAPSGEKGKLILHQLDEHERDWRSGAADRDRQGAILGFVQRIRQLLSEDDPLKALRELDSAEKRAGTCEQFELLRVQIEDHLQDQVNALIQEAGTAFERGHHGVAIQALKTALGLSPTDEWIHDRLNQAYAALSENQERRDQLQEAEGLMQSDRLDAATKKLEAVEHLWGAGPDVDVIRRRLNDARLTKRRGAAGFLLDQAHEAYRNQDLLKARLMVAEVIELLPEHEGAHKLAKMLDSASKSSE